jgi:hypothetical protein
MSVLGHRQLAAAVATEPGAAAPTSPTVAG